MNVFAMKLLLALLISLLAHVTIPAFASDKDVMVYRYWDWGITPQRDDYQVAVLKLPLEGGGVDFTASAPRAEFEKLLPVYQKVLLSVRPRTTAGG